MFLRPVAHGYWDPGIKSYFLCLFSHNINYVHSKIENVLFTYIIFNFKMRWYVQMKRLAERIYGAGISIIYLVVWVGYDHPADCDACEIKKSGIWMSPIDEQLGIAVWNYG